MLEPASQRKAGRQRAKPSQVRDLPQIGRDYRIAGDPHTDPVLQLYPTQVRPNPDSDFYPGSQPVFSLDAPEIDGGDQRQPHAPGAQAARRRG